MQLFELYASLMLDASDFDTDIASAKEKADDFADDLEKITNPTVDMSSFNGDFDAAIDALDREIDLLDDEIHDLTLKNLDDDIANSNSQINKLTKDIDGLDVKSALVKGAIEGAVQAGTELVERAIEHLIEFAGESLDYVAESGTAVGNQLKYARESFAVTTNVVKQHVGEALAPIAIAFYDLAESMLGVTKQDKLNYMFSQLDSYKFQSIQTMRQNLAGIFGIFEEYSAKETPQMELSDMATALQSQLDYWKEYDNVTRNLSSRGLNAELFGMLADGSEGSLQTLKTLENATDTELAALNELYSEMANARNDAAETIAEAQLEVDAAVDEMISSIARIGMEMGENDTVAATMEVTNGIIDTLAAQYPSIASWVDKINAAMGSLLIGVHYSSTGQLHGGGGGPKGFAVGLDYVPTDNYPATLHEGEAVLTKLEATRWRRGENSGDNNGSVLEAILALGDGIRALGNLTVNMDGKTVGHLVAGTVSGDIGRSTRRKLVTA